MLFLIREIFGRLKQCNNIERIVNFLRSTHFEKISPLTPELNPSAQRCLPRYFTGILILNGSLRDVFISRSALKS
jgi:hypothetical protein